jgi:hypothetical protein
VGTNKHPRGPDISHHRSNGRCTKRFYCFGFSIESSELDNKRNGRADVENIKRALTSTNRRGDKPMICKRILQLLLHHLKKKQAGVVTVSAVATGFTNAFPAATESARCAPSAWRCASWPWS